MTIPEEKNKEQKVPINIGGVLGYSAITVPPSLATSLLIAANKFHVGVEVLIDSDKNVNLHLSYSFLAAQSLECALKAYLAHEGYTEIQLRKKFNHNLEKLWIEASNKAMGISPSPPNWCLILNTLHDKPYYDRYPIGLNGAVYPNGIELKDGLKDVLALAKKVIRIG